MDHKEEPNYYAIIPADVRYDKRLIQGLKFDYKILYRYKDLQ